MQSSVDRQDQPNHAGRVVRWCYADDVNEFLRRSDETILGFLVAAAGGSVELEQSNAWRAQISMLKRELNETHHAGRIYFEYSIPRLGKRIDTLILLGHVLYVLEFKIGESDFPASALDQVWDYALDLKHFHETSHSTCIAPLLIASETPPQTLDVAGTVHDDRLLRPIRVGRAQLAAAMQAAADHLRGDPIVAADWETGRYLPTPTIIEAARALYAGHTVAEISRSDASASNLTRTSNAIDEVIASSRAERCKSICFVTGVPGAGKTLVGLDVANRHMNPEDDLYSVYLSGNGPLVKVLCEALARDLQSREALNGRSMRKGDAVRRVRTFIQAIHHFRDECLSNPTRPPPDHVALFDEAQRAWNLEQTRSFMHRKKGLANFAESEPEFLISCLDRHEDWAVVVCLVGGGQEINTGEGGIGEWIDALLNRFPHWRVFLSSDLHHAEYAAASSLARLRERSHVCYRDELHLAVSMRSFRAETLSEFVRLTLNLEVEAAREALGRIRRRYPIVLTRNVDRARAWLREQARGTERFGIVVSSQAQRLKPHAIDVRAVIDPVKWFLAEKTDTRSSYYLEDVATEFQVQGLELDWACVVWDGDLRHEGRGWSHNEFRGSRWQRILKEDRQRYLLNAYRVLLTRARQGMVIVVPQGADNDPTRSPRYYDQTYQYLRDLGITVLS